MRPFFLFLTISVLMAGVIIDVISTAYGIRTFGLEHERNPLMKSAMQNLGVASVLLLKFVADAFAIYLLAWGIQRAKTKQAVAVGSGVLAFFIVVQFGVDALNILFIAGGGK